MLVEMGRTAEGLELLQAALREGAPEELHPMARACHASCPLLPRVEAAFASHS